MQDNTTHSAFQLRITSSRYGDLAMSYPGSAAAGTITTFTHLLSGDQIKFEVYHSNSSHADWNSGRRIFFSGFAISGI